eukprot:TRINITY_DN28013_c0_g1_i1.p1 TRINITY_DN28013_c0_g1~~TRINITY_DN28013_c0_g1_i1.p1  ORF type:complete len:526 (+),score=104.60 TRINITY_DN28013_c0_g1_i1:76-1653(+)
MAKPRGFRGALVLLALLPQCSGLRGLTSTEVEQAAAAAAPDCACMKGEIPKCSSCQLSECPFERSRLTAIRALGIENGADIWKVSFDSGKDYVLKLGGPQLVPVQAARLAHMLGVSSPRTMLIGLSNCRKLWDSAADFATKAELFAGDVEYNSAQFSWGVASTHGEAVILQEYVDRDADEEVFLAAPEEAVMGPLPTQWQELGAVAALDWLVAKANLFNAVKMPFMGSPAKMTAEAAKIRKLVMTNNHVVDVDLNVEKRHCQWTYWRHMTLELKKEGHSDFLRHWIDSVVLPVAQLVKSGSIPTGTESDKYVTFGRWSPKTPNGFDPDLSAAEIEMGFLTALQTAMEAFSKTPEKFHTLDGAKYAATMEPDVYKKAVNSHNERLEEARVKATARRSAWKQTYSRCCQVVCDYASRAYFAGSFGRPLRKQCPATNPRYINFKLVHGHNEAKEGELYKKHGFDRDEDGCEDVYKKRQAYGEEWYPGFMKQLKDVCNEAEQCKDRPNYGHPAGLAEVDAAKYCKEKKN